MAVAIEMNFKGATIDQYDQVIDKMGLTGGSTPPGAISHWVAKTDEGIRVEEHVETAGLDVAEHGMWGYPEFYIPVPGGYGTESHSHLIGKRHEGHAIPLEVPEAEAEAA